MENAYVSVVVNDTEWAEVITPDYPIEGYFIWSAAGQLFYSSRAEDKSDAAPIPDTIQPKPCRVRKFHPVAGQVLEYVKSGSGADTLWIDFVPK